MTINFGELLNTFTYLKEGDGYACAWHNNTKPWASFLDNDILFMSLENVGALYPMGSEKKKIT